MLTNHVAAEEGERDEYGGGEDRLTEFLTLVENCISANQLRHACLDIKMVEEFRVKIKYKNQGRNQIKSHGKILVQNSVLLIGLNTRPWPMSAAKSK